MDSELSFGNTETGEDTEDILSKMEQVMPKYCVPRKFETEEQQSLDEGSEKQNDWRSLLFELSPTVRIFWAEKYNHYINPNGKYQALLGFTDMRERFLQASHGSSTEGASGRAMSRNLFLTKQAKSGWCIRRNWQKQSGADGRNMQERRNGNNPFHSLRCPCVRGSMTFPPFPAYR